MDDRSVVVRLTSLLKENGERILSGNSPLCLTVGFLRFLDDALRSINGDEDFLTSFEALPGNCTPLPYCHELQFLYDFVQKTPALKLIANPVTNQPDCHGDDLVSMVVFRSLQELELKRVPVRSTSGISKLRGKLRRLVCSYSLYTLQELLEECGADGSTALVWNQLTALNLSYNSVTHLDSSLRLLPVLVSLDLSHNLITDPQSHLEHLTELMEVNLGCNLLTSVPSFSLSSASRLTVLSLRNNCLETITGVQELRGLKQLDLSQNCLMSHCLLHPLTTLHRLAVLALEGNPLSLHDKHRLLTMEHIHPSAADELVIDKKPLTESEKQAARQAMYKDKSKSHEQQVTSQAQTNPPINYQPYEVENGDTNISDQSEQVLRTRQTVVKELATSPAKNIASSKNHTRGRRKTRTAEISDIDSIPPDSGSGWESSPVSSFKNSSGFREESNEAHSQAQTEVRTQAQTLRDLYGDRWLQVHSGSVKRSEILSRVPRKPAPEQDDGDVPGTEAEKGMETDNGRTSRRNADKNGQSKLSDNVSARIEPAPITEQDSLVDKVNESEAANRDAASAVICDPEPRVSMPTKEQSSQPSERQPSGSADHRPSESTEKKGFVSDRRPSGSKASQNKTSDNIFSWSQNESETVDYGQESEPFIVQICDADAPTVVEEMEHFLLTVTERYLLEKDIEGIVVEALDLKCLRSAEIMPSHDNGVKVVSGEHSHVVLQLLFDYYKKDKCERRYIMEDESSAQGLLELVSPFIDLRLIADALEERVKCLRCGKEFSKDEAVSSTQSEDDKQGLVCPVCQSGMVVKVDIGQVARSVGQGGHQGKMTSSPRSKGILHDPTVHSTPAKRHIGARQLYGVTPPGSDSNLQRTSSSRTLPFDSSPSGTLGRNTSATSLEGDTHPKQAATRDRDGSLYNSTDSGITILHRQDSHNGRAEVVSARDSVSSACSDIAVISRGSEEQILGLSPIPDSMESLGGPAEPSPDLTPCGSLSDKAIHSMVTSMYQNCSLPAHSDTTNFHSLEGSTAGPHNGSDHLFRSIDPGDPEMDESCRDMRPSSPTEDLDPGLVHFSGSDFTNIDHRLKLYLDMTVFNEDEFKLLLQCDVVQYLEAQQYRGILIVTDTNFYVFKITGSTNADDITSWLRQTHKQHLQEICYVMIGYGGQSFRIETGKDESSFTFLIREDKLCKLFLKPFTELVQQVAFSSASQLEGIKTDHMTPANIINEILTGVEADMDIKMYVMCYLQIGAIEVGSGAMTPVSIILTSSHIAMATENHHIMKWRPDMEGSHDTSSGKFRQFEVKDIQLVTDITHIEQTRSQPRKISLTFEEEGSTDEYTWRLFMASSGTREALLKTIKELWEGQFGVDMSITEGV